MKKAFIRTIACVLTVVLLSGSVQLQSLVSNVLPFPSWTQPFEIEAKAQTYTPKNKIEYDGHLYVLYDEALSWEEARNACVQLGGHLAVITASQEQAAVQTLVSSGTRVRYWLGATDVVTEGSYKWTTGEEFLYMNWNTGQPDNFNSTEHYLTINTNGKWNDVPINAIETGFICEFEDFYTPVKAIRDNDRIYSLYNEAMTWTEAKAFCEKQSGHLITVESLHEQSILETLLEAGIRDFYWLGASDVEVEGVFNWVTHEPFSYTNWATNQPDNWQNNEHYLHAYRANGKWNDAKNELSGAGFICEVEIDLFEPVAELVYGGSNYSLYDNKVSWTVANLFSEFVGGHLVTITSEEEQQKVIELIANGARSSYWLGATDTNRDRIFSWVTGEVFSYTNWFSNQPDNFIYREFFLEMRSTYNWQWNDVSDRGASQEYNGFIVEKANNVSETKNIAVYDPNGGEYLGKTEPYQEEESFFGRYVRFYSSGSRRPTDTYSTSIITSGNNKTRGSTTNPMNHYTEISVNCGTENLLRSPDVLKKSSIISADMGEYEIASNRRKAFCWTGGMPGRGVNTYILDWVPREDPGLCYLNDGNTTTISNYSDTYGNSITIDLGEKKEITDIDIWRYYADGRGYFDCVVLISEDNNFDNNDYVVWNSDRNETWWTRDTVYEINGEARQIHNKFFYDFGEGKDEFYYETSTGKKMYIGPKNGQRYIIGNYNTIPSKPGHVFIGWKLNDGEIYQQNDRIDNWYSETGTDIFVAQWMPKQQSKVVYYDPNGGEYAGSNERFVEQQSFYARYIGLYSSGSKKPDDVYSSQLIVNGITKTHGSSTNPGNHYVEVEIYDDTKNIMRNPVVLQKSSITGVKTVANDYSSTANKAGGWTSGIIGIGSNTYLGEYNDPKVATYYSNINDGLTSTNGYCGSVGQRIIIDLGARHDISRVKVWRYFGDSRGYFDCVIVLSEDPYFDNNDYIVWNSDRNETWWESNTVFDINGNAWSIEDNFDYDFGYGKDPFYNETSAGKEMFVGAKNGQRYVVGNYTDIPVRFGYKFVGWKLNDGQVYQHNDVIPVWNSMNDNDVFIAQWELNQYVLTYNLCGGVDGPETQTKYHDTAISISQTLPMKKHFMCFNSNGGQVSQDASVLDCTFSSWNTEEDGSGIEYLPGATFNNNEDTVLYAIWNNPFAGTLPEPVRVGYTFIGWFDSLTEGEQIVSNSSITHDIEIFARWSFNYHIHYNGNGGTGEPSEQIKVEDRSLVLTLSIPEQAKRYVLSYNVAGGHPLEENSKNVLCLFDRWNTEPNGNGIDFWPGDTYNENKSITLFACWKDPTVGDLPIPSKTGYTFLGWFSEIEGGTPIISETIINGDMEVYAHWRPRSLLEVRLATVAEKSEYYVGENLEKEGISLNAIFDNGESEIITEGFLCSPMTMRRAGTQRISVSFLDNTMTFYVTVLAVQITDVSIETPPYKTIYNQNESFSGSGMTLKAIFNNGTEKIISTGYIVSYDFSSQGIKSVNVFYSEGGVTVLTSLIVEVVVNNVVFANPVIAEAGETIIVPIFINENQGMMGFSINIGYDPSILTPVSANPGTVLEGGMFNDSISTASIGQFKVLWTGSQDVLTDGVIFTISFSVNPNAKGNSQILLSYNQGDTFNENWQDVVLNCDNISIIVNNAYYITPPNLWANPASVTAGDFISFPVSIENHSAMSKFIIYLTYDPTVYTYISINKGDALQTGDMVATANNGVLTVTWAGISQDGVVFTPIFETFPYKHGRYDIEMSYNQDHTQFGTAGTVMQCGNIEVAISNPFIGQPAWVLADQTQAAVGDTVIIPIRIFNNQGLMGFGITLNYDPNVLMPLTITRGTATVTGMFDSTLGAGNSGNIKVIWNNSENMSINGILMEVTFSVKIGALIGESALNLSFSQEDTFNEDWDDVFLNCQSTTITITNNPFILNTKNDSSAVLDRNNWFLYGLQQGTTVEDLLTNYFIIPTNASVYLDSSVVGTGVKLELKDNTSGMTIEFFYIVMFGDVNGDGSIGSIDADRIIDYTNWVYEWDATADGAYLRAADVNGDGVVDAVDADIIIEFENWRMSINQATGLAVPN